MTRRRWMMAACMALAGCHKAAPQQVAGPQAPQAPQVRIGQAGSIAFAPTVAATGTVAPRKIAPVKPGTPRVRSYFLNIVLPAADVGRIALGATAKVTFAVFGNDTIVGRVIGIADGGAVEISLPNDARLHAGQAGTARIVATGAATRVLAVPPSALFDRQGTGAQVYVVDLATSRLHLRHVTTGTDTEAGIGITAGLRLGEWVALSRPDTLRDGMKIAPLGPDS